MLEQLVHIRLKIEREPEGGYSVTSPDVPELVTGGDTWEEMWEMIRDALSLIMEVYRDEGRTLNVVSDEASMVIDTEAYYPVPVVVS